MPCIPYAMHPSTTSWFIWQAGTEATINAKNSRATSRLIVMMFLFYESSHTRFLTDYISHGSFQKSGALMQTQNRRAFFGAEARTLGKLTSICGNSLTGILSTSRPSFAVLGRTCRDGLPDGQAARWSRKSPGRSGLHSHRQHPGLLSSILFYFLGFWGYSTTIKPNKCILVPQGLLNSPASEPGIHYLGSPVVLMVEGS